MRGDENLESVSYVQNVEHFRPDVIALDTELLKLPSYVSQVRREHPSLLIPFASYDGGVNTSLNTLVADNIAKRPVFYIGTQVEKRFGKPFDQVIEGLSTRLEPKGSALDEYAVLAKHPALYASFHFPPKAYPKSSWEGHAIEPNYALEAFDVAYAIEAHDAADEASLGEKLYATAIRLDAGLDAGLQGLRPDAEATTAATSNQIIPLWAGPYLRLNPRDPQAPAIRRVLDRLIAAQK